MNVASSDKGNRVMNKARRTTLEKLSDKLCDLRTELEEILTEEQEAYDNMPESLQNGDKGEAAQTVISEIEEAISSIENAVGNIDTAKE